MTAPVSPSHPVAERVGEHTPTPWILDGVTVYYLDWDGVSYEGRGKDYRQQLTNRFWFSLQGSPKRIPKEELEANAAFIVEAVNNHARLTSEIEALRTILRQSRDAMLRTRTASIAGCEEGYGKPEKWGDELFASHHGLTASIKAIDAALQATEADEGKP